MLRGATEGQNEVSPSSSVCEANWESSVLQSGSGDVAPVRQLVDPSRGDRTSSCKCSPKRKVQLRKKRNVTVEITFSLMVS